MLARATAWTLLSNAAMAVSQWAVLAVCARQVSTAALGEMAWAMAVVLPLHLCAGLQQRTAVATAGPGTMVQHIRVRVVTSLIVAIAAGGIAWSAPIGVVAITLWLALARGAEGIGEIALGQRQRAHGFAAIAGAQVARAGLQITGAVVGAWFGHSSEAIAAGVAIGSVAALLMAELPLLVRSRSHSDEARADWPLFMTLLPLGLALGLTALAGSAPRLVLEAEHGPEMLGWFAAIAAAVAVLNQVVGAMVPGLSTTLAEAGRVRDTVRIRRLVLLFALIGLAAALVAGGASLFLGGPVLAWIFGREFAQLGPELTLLCMATAVDLLALPVCVALTALGVWRQQIAMLAAMVVVATVVAWLAIPQGEIAGVSLALASAYLLRLVWAIMLLGMRLAQLDAERARDQVSA